VGVSDSGGASSSSTSRCKERSFAMPFSGLRVLPWFFWSWMLKSGIIWDRVSYLKSSCLSNIEIPKFECMVEYVSEFLVGN
jgi:hypothetical protein